MKAKRKTISNVPLTTERQAPWNPVAAMAVLPDMNRPLAQALVTLAVLCSACGGTPVEEDRFAPCSLEEHCKGMCEIDSRRILDPYQKEDVLKALWKNFGVNNSGPDLDEDGWSDEVEGLLGTDPDSADTDSDGLSDSQDRNPLAAPKKLKRHERILVSAIDQLASGFEFTSEYYPTQIALVYWPDDARYAELDGIDGLVIPARKGKDNPLAEVASSGTGIPLFTFLDDHNEPEEYNCASLILFDPSRTFASVHLGYIYDCMGAVFFRVDFSVSLLGWVVAGSEVTGIS